MRLLEACYTQSARGVLLYPENLPESFFDFELGIVLSVHTKLRLYGARLAIVTEPGEALYSARLGSWNSRESGMPGIGLFPTRQDALDWLTGVKP